MFKPTRWAVLHLAGLALSAGIADNVYAQATFWDWTQGRTPYYKPCGGCDQAQSAVTTPTTTPVPTGYGTSAPTPYSNAVPTSAPAVSAPANSLPAFSVPTVPTAAYTPISSCSSCAPQPSAMPRQASVIHVRRLRSWRHGRLHSDGALPDYVDPCSGDVLPPRNDCRSSDGLPGDESAAVYNVSLAIRACAHYALRLVLVLALALVTFRASARVSCSGHRRSSDGHAWLCRAGRTELCCAGTTSSRHPVSVLWHTGSDVGAGCAFGGERSLAGPGRFASDITASGASGQRSHPGVPCAVRAAGQLDHNAGT